MDKKICYCYDHTESDIQRDVRKNDGESSILEKILSAKKRGECQCSTMHPEGR
jgi:hypothetical protein